MKKEVTVQSKRMADARALAELVAKANEFESSIFYKTGNGTVNAKSIMGVMGLGFDIGKKIEIEAQGNDEDKAVEALAVFLGE